MRNHPGGHGLFWVLFLLALVVPAAGAGMLEYRGDVPAPRVEVTPGLPAVGQRTPITVTVRAPERGLGDVKVELLQGTLSETLHEQHSVPRAPLRLWEKPKHTEATVTVEVGKQVQSWLTPGEATLRVTAEHPGTFFTSHEPVVQTINLPVQLIPPDLTATSMHVYVTQGGSEVVVYRVGKNSVKDGVQAGPWFFPGQPLPGGAPDEKFALFAIPYDMDRADDVKLVATDALGNRSEATFIHKFTPRPMGRDTIQLSDAFMQKVVGEILPRTPNLQDKRDALQNYLQLNGTLRKTNADFLRELAAKSTPKFLWSEPFQPLAGAKVMGSFADRRTYLHNGQPVDTQDHLGFDLASRAQAPVTSANSGVVVHAGYLGIYGNTVVVDHGYGLMSLYAHLSAIDVAPDATVTRGQVLGRTGATGLAGGDHLHFTMMLHGLPVTPIEWWDGKWINDRLRLKLGDALPSSGKRDG